MADLQALADAVIKGNQAESVRLTQEALDESRCSLLRYKDGPPTRQPLVCMKKPSAS